MGLNDYQEIFGTATANFNDLAESILKLLSKDDIDEMIKEIYTNERLRSILKLLKKHDRSFVDLFNTSKFNKASDRSEMIIAFTPLFKNLLLLQLNTLKKCPGDKFKEFAIKMAQILSDKIELINFMNTPEEAGLRGHISLADNLKNTVDEYVLKLIKKKEELYLPDKSYSEISKIANENFKKYDTYMKILSQEYAKTLHELYKLASVNDPNMAIGDFIESYVNKSANKSANSPLGAKYHDNGQLAVAIKSIYIEQKGGSTNYKNKYMKYKYKYINAKKNRMHK